MGTMLHRSNTLLCKFFFNSHFFFMAFDIISVHLQMSVFLAWALSESLVCVMNLMIFLLVLWNCVCHWQKLLYMLFAETLFLRYHPCHHNSPSSQKKGKSCFKFILLPWSKCLSPDVVGLWNPHRRIPCVFDTSYQMAKVSAFNASMVSIRNVRRFQCIWGLADKPRVGIAVGSKAVGFVFVDPSSSVSHLRDAISDQVSHFTYHNILLYFLQYIFPFQLTSVSQVNFQFIDCNGWPVTTEQEYELTVLDLLHKSMVRINSPLCTDESDSGISSADFSVLPPACKRLK
jgi:hypothetical protein